MNRPRNRQPRPPPKQAKDGSTDRQLGRQQTSRLAKNVPTSQQVQPGASVSIVLKADQRTGREVQGTVQDLLTRGNHPHGIKVRLQDGRIGRVQRVTSGESSNVSSTPILESRSVPKQSTASVPVDTRRDHDDANSSLADAEDHHSEGVKDSDLVSSHGKYISLSSASVTCPICNEFEGDEAAVSHHVQTHLDQNAPP